MKKTVLFSVLLFFSLAVAAYGNTGDSQQVKQRVEAIYKTVFSTYNRTNDYTSIPDFDSRFCSKAWNDNKKKVEKIQEQGDEPFFDADYWVMGQDFSNDLHITDVKVVNISNTEATVNMKVHNFGHATPVTLKIVFERGDWYIDNIMSEGMDLKEDMKEYIKEYGKSRRR